MYSFEAQGTSYTMFPMLHGKPVTPDVSSLDALVVEKKVIQDISLPQSFPPIYSVDAGIERDVELFFHTLHYGALTTVPSLVALAAGKPDLAFFMWPITIVANDFINRTTAYTQHPLLRKHHSLQNLFMQSPIAELRNAIASYRLQNGLIPHLEETKGDSVHLGLFYGALHAGLEDCLKHPLRTKFTLKLHEHYGRKLLGDPDLNQFYEYKPWGKRYTSITHRW